ncbi:carboxyl transferase [Nitritalea halalkaliphila LW7]|uniref:Carboxyl transferase n=1 Tax=Nitritalea halalkaliphila LW7 TaxID=1189621 RepID=I5CA29_9BACT|nr:carboxyl transferase [Nitritalea halalkaliphila LW7]
MDSQTKGVYTLPSNQEKIELLKKKNAEALLGGGEERIAAQHKKRQAYCARTYSFTDG